jgi:hypothetical protein
MRQPMDPDAIDRVLRKYARAIGLETAYSAHSIRATFVPTTLENGASLEDLQQGVGQRDSGHHNSMTCAATTGRNLLTAPRISKVVDHFLRHSPTSVLIQFIHRHAAKTVSQEPDWLHALNS